MIRLIIGLVLLGSTVLAQNNNDFYQNYLKLLDAGMQKIDREYQQKRARQLEYESGRQTIITFRKTVPTKEVESWTVEYNPSSHIVKGYNGTVMEFMLVPDPSSDGMAIYKKAPDSNLLILSGIVKKPREVFTEEEIKKYTITIK